MNWDLAALAAALIAAWSHVRAVGAWFLGLVVVTQRCDYRLGAILLSYMHVHFYSRGVSHGAYGCDPTYLVEEDRVSDVAYQMLNGSSRMYWRKWRPLHYAPMQSDANETNGTLSTLVSVFAYARGTFDWERLVTDAVAWSSGHARVRHKLVYHHGTTLAKTSDDDEDRYTRFGYINEWGPDKGMRPIGHDPATLGAHAKCVRAPLSLGPELDDTTAEINHWFTMRKWYRDRGIPWRRGFAFHGLPGVGKTSFARERAEELDLPVHIFDLASMSNQDLREAWDKMLHDAPCMALIEDIDSVFHERENVTPDGSLTFDALLNAIDGVASTDGVLFVVTTNHLDHLDDALVNRKGRVDRVVEFRPLAYAGRLAIARRILKDEDAARELAMSSEDVPAAAFQETCFRIALEGIAPKDGPYR